MNLQEIKKVVPEIVSIVNRNRQRVEKRAAGQVNLYSGQDAQSPDVLAGIEDCYRLVYGSPPWNEGYFCSNNQCPDTGIAHRISLQKLPKDGSCVSCASPLSEYHPKGEIADKFTGIFNLKDVYPIASVWHSPDNQVMGFAITPVLRGKEPLNLILLREKFFTQAVSDPEKELETMWQKLGVPSGLYMFSSDICVRTGGTKRTNQLLFVSAAKAISRGCIETIGVTTQDTAWFTKLTKKGFIKPEDIYTTSGDEPLCVYRIPMIGGVAYYGFMSLIDHPLAIAKLSQLEYRKKHASK